MEKNTKKSEPEQNFKIGLLPAAVVSLFERCFEKAEININDESGRDGWPVTLIGRMKEKLTKYNNATGFGSSFDGYLRDRYREACAACENNPNEPLKYFYNKISPLFEYAGIADFNKFNDSFKPKELKANAVISVIYASKPYGRFKFLRVAHDFGSLYFFDKNFKFIGEEGNFTVDRETIKKNAEAWSMNDGPLPLWVKVVYEKDGVPHDAYFAEALHGKNNFKPLSPENLLSYFNKLLSVSGNL